MALWVVSFFAGALTVAAPCILPLLPVVVGGSIARGGEESKQRRKWLRPLVITGSLAASVILFTLLLKFSTALLGVSQEIWQIIAGGIVILLGLYFLVPAVWEKIALKTNLHTASNQFFGKTFKNKGLGGDVLMGVALGPVFNSCSPTYLFIVATVLPVSFAEGFAYLVSYAIGLSAALLAVAYLGQSLVAKLGWLSKPSGWFRRIIGLLFMLVGIAIIFGLDKDFQTFVLEQGWYAPISNLEESLR